MFDHLRCEGSGYALKRPVTQPDVDIGRRQCDAAHERRGPRDPVLPVDEISGNGLNSPLATMSRGDFGAEARNEPAMMSAVAPRFMTRSGSFSRS